MLFAARRLSVQSLRKVPWDTLILLGGSFALAAGIEGSGLSQWMTLQLAGVAGLPPWLQIAGTAAAISRRRRRPLR